MKIALIGDVMLARRVGKAFAGKNISPLSDEIKSRLEEADYRIANLESPMVETPPVTDDHMLFCGDPILLDQFKNIDCFVLANNHINDAGTEGMSETIRHLEERGMGWHGLHKEAYSPQLIEEGGVRVALFVCADMMNEPIDDNSPWHVPFVDDPQLDVQIAEYKSLGYTVILYAHVGMLFTRFPNPPVRRLMQKKVDAGVDVVVTVHPHVIGGLEWYKGKPIFYSLGDFVMDGSSARRRRAMLLTLDIAADEKLDYDLSPTRIGDDLKTSFAKGRERDAILHNWRFVSRKLEKHTDSYERYFRWRYRVEILHHISSTLLFLIRSRGVGGTLKLLKLRMREVFLLRKWVMTDRSAKRMDDDAIAEDRDRISEGDVYGEK